jgi:hypothetical protein
MGLPKPLSVPYGRFEFFRKFSEIFGVQGAPQVSLTQVANGTSFQQEKF